MPNKTTCIVDENCKSFNAALRGSANKLKTPMTQPVAEVTKATPSGIFAMWAAIPAAMPSNKKLGTKFRNAVCNLDVMDSDVLKVPKDAMSNNTPAAVEHPKMQKIIFLTTKEG
ncbi:MAG: hypothetical protein HC853_06485 [Anaerolineae bacterium]|nr:hypothetical protein [Anaerolineae bacterium]